ncbi:MAG: Hsp20/alpha crystallin family protein [Phycisphaerales bacterium]|jgi:HSP20 family protein|nr:Hsp20/alpha crystallin family protein [Phycisphaerales bacterium]
MTTEMRKQSELCKGVQNNSGEHKSTRHGTFAVIKDACHKLSDSLHPRHQKRHINLATPVDVFEEATSFIVLVDVAGAHDEDIQVTVEGDTLHVHGQIKHSSASKVAGMKSRVQEFEDGEFCRRIRLGGEIEIEQIEAHTSQGIMTIHLPKLKTFSRKNVTVEVA